jgi:hypothetical protein
MFKNLFSKPTPDRTPSPVPVRSSVSKRSISPVGYAKVVSSDVDPAALASVPTTPTSISTPATPTTPTTEEDKKLEVKYPHLMIKSKNNQQFRQLSNTIGEIISGETIQKNLILPSRVSKSGHNMYSKKMIDDNFTLLFDKEYTNSSKQFDKIIILLGQRSETGELYETLLIEEMKKFQKTACIVKNSLIGVKFATMASTATVAGFLASSIIAAPVAYVIGTASAAVGASLINDLSSLYSTINDIFNINLMLENRVFDNACSYITFLLENYNSISDDGSDLNKMKKTLLAIPIYYFTTNTDNFILSFILYRHHLTTKISNTLKHIINKQLYFSLCNDLSELYTNLPKDKSSKLYTDIQQKITAITSGNHKFYMYDTITFASDAPRSDVNTTFGDLDEDVDYESDDPDTPREDPIEEQEFRSGLKELVDKLQTDNTRLRQERIKIIQLPLQQLREQINTNFADLNIHGTTSHPSRTAPFDKDVIVQKRRHSIGGKYTFKRFYKNRNVRKTKKYRK